MNKPLVSILIPVYNVEEYLERCLDSLVKQTLTDIEIICVNDGSKDNSLEILKKYQEKDNRIIIVDKENGGLPSARNAGLDQAQGKYVGFVDSDDYVDVNMFKRLYQTAERENSEVVICGAEIFPEVPRANGWLYACLSPWYQHYDTFDPKVLFEHVCTTPFLWRVLVKRDLIERNQFRLDETIHIGEDKAFQAKIYPAAQGITVIPDKLYHYCWYREGSLMNQDVYVVSDKKIKSHCMLIQKMGVELKKSEANDDTMFEFLKWSIPFLYGDFIYAPLATKVMLSNEVVRTWTECGYYNLKSRLPEWIIEQFEYFYDVTKCENIDVEVSVVVPISDKTEYIEEALDSILKQNCKVECILVNNGTSNETYSILHKYLFKDKRIRLHNMEKGTYADALNKGIGLAVGEYVTCCETDGWYNNPNSLKLWLENAKENDLDVCASVSAVKSESSFARDHVYDVCNETLDDRTYIDVDFHHYLFKKSFLEEKVDIKFENSSILTGLPFVVKQVLSCDKKGFYNKICYVRRNLHQADWLSTEKCERVLEALDKLMTYAVDNKNAHVQAKILSILNEDYFKKIIINNTRAYVMPPETNPNGENSQVNTFKYVYSCFSKVDATVLEAAGYRVDVTYSSLLFELIRERQKFLADLSNKF